MLLWLSVAFSVLTSVRAGDLTSEFAHHAVLDPKELMKLYWTVNWEKESVSFAVEAATTGWVGFGFSSGNGKMIGSDVVIGWVKDSKVFLTDRYANAKSLPLKDKEQNYILTGFEEADQKTILKFTRKFDTCDPKDRKITRGTTKIVFAFHPEDPTSEIDIKQHTFRGSRSILLLNNMDKKQINETGWDSFVLANKNITIPKKDTTYWCSLIKAPEITTKHHITKFEPYTQKGNEGFVHHFLVYECYGVFNDTHYGAGWDCIENANMPSAVRQCYANSIVAVWGFGGEAFYYPENTGFPIGTPDSPKSYLLEIHYDNPEMVEGRKDSSGVRFYYTSNLRQHDSGIFAVGDSVTSYMVIPPKQESWMTVGYCPKECYQKNLESTPLPEKGIKVFAAFLHTHLQGRATWTKHYRNGVELPEIARDDNYDFNFQDIQVLRKETHIRPGDDLVHYCKYQTIDRDKLVTGGESTAEEMCLNFLFYYPRMENITQYCTSLQYNPVKGFINKFFPAVNASWPNPLVAMNMTWNDEMVSDLRKRFDEAQGFTALCFRGRKSPIPWLKIPKTTKPLPPVESKCPQRTPKDPESSSSLVAAYRMLVLFLSALYAFL